MPRTFIVVHGVVQGVGYRYFVLTKAREHSIKGFVRNADDGSVEILAEYGSTDELDRFIEGINVDTAHGAQVFKIERDDSRLEPFGNESFDKFRVVK